MRLRELLENKVFWLDRQLRVWQDPSFLELTELVKKIGELRGTSAGNNIWVWKAGEALHGLENKLGISRELGRGGLGLEDFFITPEGIDPGEPNWLRSKYKTGAGMTIWYRGYSDNIPQGLKRLLDRMDKLEIRRQTPKTPEVWIG